MIIVNGHILTMEQQDYENGYIEFEGGKIVKIGDMASFDAGSCDQSQVLDAHGGYVLPGLIDAHTHLGMWGDSLGFEGDDGNEDTDPSTPHLRAIDAINPQDRSFSEAYHAGVTTVLTGPGSTNPVGGQFAAVKTYGRRIDDMVLAAPAAIKFALGENPKNTYHEKNQAPITRMATAAIIRDVLFKAREYLEAQRRAQTEEDCDKPDFDLKLESLIPLLEGKIAAHFHAHRADDIFTAIRIATEFRLKYVIVHGTEGHLIADILKRENTSVIAGPLLGFRSKPELKNMSFRTPVELIRKGIPTALCTDHPETPINLLLLCASLVEKEGLEEMDVLKAVTIRAAEIAGLEKRVGSLKVGKDADFVVFDGPPLELKSKVRAVYINGEQVVTQ